MYTALRGIKVICRSCWADVITIVVSCMRHEGAVRQVYGRIDCHCDLLGMTAYLHIVKSMPGAPSEHKHLEVICPGRTSLGVLSSMHA